MTALRPADSVILFECVPALMPAMPRAAAGRALANGRHLQNFADFARNRQNPSESAGIGQILVNSDEFLCFLESINTTHQTSNPDSMLVI